MRVLGLALILGSWLGAGSPTRAEAGPSIWDDPRVQELVQQAESEDAATRVRAIEELARLKVPRVARKLAPRLEAAPLGDREAEAILRLLDRAPDGSMISKVATWLVRVVGPTGVLEEPLLGPLADPGGTRSLELAVRIAGRGTLGPEAARAVATLASHPELEVAKAALQVAEGSRAVRAAEHVDSWLVALDRGHPTLMDPALVLLGRAKVMSTVPRIITSAERSFEANPRRRGAPEHGKALRAITGQKLGDDPAVWRRWWAARGR